VPMTLGDPADQFAIEVIRAANNVSAPWRM
jgi:hypothetical protein